MKLTLIVVIFMASFSALAKSPANFNEALLKDVEKEIKKDDESFKKASARAPASVEGEYDHPIEETPKIDKNVRQIGPNRW